MCETTSKRLYLPRTHIWICSFSQGVGLSSSIDWYTGACSEHRVKKTQKTKDTSKHERNNTTAASIEPVTSRAEPSNNMCKKRCFEIYNLLARPVWYRSSEAYIVMGTAAMVCCLALASYQAWIVSPRQITTWKKVSMSSMTFAAEVFYRFTQVTMVLV